MNKERYKAQLQRCKEYILTQKELPSEVALGCYDMPELKDDKDLLTEILPLSYRILQYTSPRLKNDIEFVKLAVTHNGINYNFISEELKDNKEILEIAMKTNSEAILNASQRLQCDIDIAFQAIIKTQSIYEKLPKKIKENKILAMKLVEHDPKLIKYVVNLWSSNSETIKIISGEAPRSEGRGFKYL